jgi:hypothetical protein
MMKVSSRFAVKWSGIEAEWYEKTAFITDGLTNERFELMGDVEGLAALLNKLSAKPPGEFINCAVCGQPTPYNPNE